MSADLLGRREDQTTEFKTADALREPGGIAREIVGMLNAGGGTIYIGVDEKDGKAVAINPVANPQREMDRLLDFLVDTLDPSPTPEEVSIESLPPGTAPAVLKIRTDPKEHRKPYSFRKGGGLHFLRRVGARNLQMSRQEVGQAFLGPNSQPENRPVEEARQWLVESRAAAQQSRGEGLWLGMRPERLLALDPEDSRLEEIASDPLITGNRRSGWHFARSSIKPRLRKDRVEWGLRWESENAFVSQVTVTTDGALEYWASLRRLHWKGEEHELWPFALLEYPISAFRIARLLYLDHLDSDDEVITSLALLGIAGWMLRPGSPGDFFLTEDPIEVKEPDDLAWEPESLHFQDIEKEPDRCGFRWVRRIYHAFGLREEDIPRQYDRLTGRLILPE